MISVESSRSLRLSWDSLPEESRNGIIIGYSVFVTPDGGVTMETTTNMTTFLAANLRPFTTYTFTVAARTSIGRGPLTPASLETTPEDGRPVVLYIVHYGLNIVQLYIRYCYNIFTMCKTKLRYGEYPTLYTIRCANMLLWWSVHPDAV